MTAEDVREHKGAPNRSPDQPVWRRGPPCTRHRLRGACDAQLAPADELATSLVTAGHDVLLDDRAGVSAGVTFTDAELIGIPVTVVVGRRAAEGYVEVRDRRTGVALSEVDAFLADPARVSP